VAKNGSEKGHNMVLSGCLNIMAVFGAHLRPVNLRAVSIMHIAYEHSLERRARVCTFACAYACSLERPLLYCAFLNQDDARVMAQDRMYMHAMAIRYAGMWDTLACLSIKTGQKR
jgi:hypothetical protein